MPTKINLWDRPSRGYKRGVPFRFISGHNRKGKPPWNFGLTKETDEKTKKSAEKRTGAKRTEETIKLMQQANRGKKKKPISEEHRENLRKATLRTSWIRGLTKETDDRVKRIGENVSKVSTGRVLTESWKKNLGIASMGKPGLKGEKSPHWLGGKTFEIYPQAFFEIRPEILERDNYTCQLCDKKGIDRYPDVHHIDYKKENNDPMNLISLCNKDHARANRRRKEYLPFLELFMLGKYGENLNELT